MKKYKIILYALPYLVAVLGAFGAITPFATLALILGSLAYPIAAGRLFGDVSNGNTWVAYSMGLVYAFVCVSLVFSINRYPGSNVVLVSAQAVSLLMLFYYLWSDSKFEVPVKLYLIGAVQVLAVIYLSMTH